MRPRISFYDSYLLSDEAFKKCENSAPIVLSSTAIGEACLKYAMGYGNYG